MEYQSVPCVKEQTAPDLNTTFGLPESFRKIIAAGLIATTAFLAGCARSMEETVSDFKSLSAPPMASIVEHPDWFLNNHVTVRGVPTYLADASYESQSSVPFPTGRGMVYIPISTNHTRLIYTLNNDDMKGIQVRSNTELDSAPLVLSGYMRKEERHRAGYYFEADASVPQAVYDKSVP